jgi:hypothetical protein
LDNYDSSKFDLDKALENAKGDFVTLKTIVGNQFNTVMAQLGEKILPTVAKSLLSVSNFIEKVYNNWDTMWPIIETGVKVVGGAVIIWKLWTAAQWAFNVAATANPIGILIVGITALIVLIISAIKYYDKWGAAMMMLMGPIGFLVNMVMSFKKHWDEITSAFKDGGILAGLKQIGLALLDALLYPVQQLLELLGKIPGVGKLAVSGAEWIHNLRKNVLGIKVEEPQTDATPEEDPFAPEPGKPKGATPGAGGTGGGGGDPIDKITGAATQQKNLTINIDSFVKGGINTAHTNLQNMDETQLEQWMTNMFMRVIRNAEMNY